MKIINDNEFETEIKNSAVPVLVDFYAEWCSPCRQLSPVLEEVSKELGDKLKVVKMNIDDSPETPTNFGVRGIPTLIMFKDGQTLLPLLMNCPETFLLSNFQDTVHFCPSFIAGIRTG